MKHVGTALIILAMLVLVASFAYAQGYEDGQVRHLTHQLDDHPRNP